MADIVMPKMSDAMEEGTVLRWLKHEGDAVEKGEPLAEIETDKANMEMEAFEAGTITGIKIPEGETVPVGTVIAELGPVGAEVAGVKGGEAVEAPAAEEKREEETPPAPPAEEAAVPTGAQAPTAPERPAVPPARVEAEMPPLPPGEEEIRASPLARKIARDAGIDLSQITGTGPGGRIVEEDVRRSIQGQPAASPAPPEEMAPSPQPEPAAEPVARAEPPPAPTPTAEGEAQELSRIRKTVAKVMVQSKQHIPHFYVTTRVRMDDAMAFRQQFNDAHGEETKVGVTDMLIKSCASALMKHPDINSSYDQGKLIRRGHANIAIAVALEDGLIAPVVPECEKKSLIEISRQSEELIAKARSGKIRPDEYSGGTFTISNMGMLDVEEFQAIIVPPESAILAVGTIYPTPIVVEEDSIEIAQMMKLTISADHRITDGAGAARFLQDVKKALEKPFLLVD